MYIYIYTHIYTFLNHVCMCIYVYYVYYCSVPIEGLFAGLKLAGLSPTKCPAKSPAKKLPRKNPVSDSQTPPSLLRPIFARPYYG